MLRTTRLLQPQHKKHGIADATTTRDTQTECRGNDNNSPNRNMRYPSHREEKKPATRSFGGGERESDTQTRQQQGKEQIRAPHTNARQRQKHILI
ncbi:hypothetical protein BDA99DRAFT_332863 [Phascolomyces articulosus]|uniref:Uncharacterized protein n=1 Tax=Phascolomyces articulosus TaxID=60185 RepID=A0AAD5P758_9FUNG|nr:hypothetical protein BDA99DRAFT_332863 [Phascolomyces articulosus]